MLERGSPLCAWGMVYILKWWDKVMALPPRASNGRVGLMASLATLYKPSK